MSSFGIAAALAALRSPDAAHALQCDFIALCDCGGRRAGTASERAALEFARSRLSEIAPAVRMHDIAYAGWRCKTAALMTGDGTPLACMPLLGSQSTPREGVAAEVCDVGRGTPDDFSRCAAAIPGRFVLVRHEYPFSASHIHRRRKLTWAAERGAAGFIIANPHANAGPVTGSSGRAGGNGIPAVGTDFESAVRLRAAAHARQRVHLVSIGEDYDARTSVLTLDLAGRTPECVVLSAHLDGHDLAESAMDNATGVAASIAIARAFAPHVPHCERGLRVCLFSAEEWALAGSKKFLDDMSDAERERIVLNVNLDTIAGDECLTALTSEFPNLDGFVQCAFAQTDRAPATYAPMMANSDHYNFARHGIPAMRLVAGFERPDSNVRFILTCADTRDKVESRALHAATIAAARLVARGLTADVAEIETLRVR